MKVTLVTRPTRRLTLRQAAALAGCHVNTLRARIREGVLTAERGPRGAYLMDADEVQGLDPVRMGRPAHPRPVLTRRELDQSWDLLAGLLVARRDRVYLDRALELRNAPEQRRGLFRLVSVHRLHAAGLADDQIAGELGISTRHVHRLRTKSLAGELHLRLGLPEIEEQRRHRLARLRAVARGLHARLVSEGIISQGRRGRHPGTGEPIVYYRRVRPDRTVAVIHRLADAGLAREEVEAVLEVGVTAEELNELMLRGQGAMRTPSLSERSRRQGTRRT